MWARPQSRLRPHMGPITLTPVTCVAWRTRGLPDGSLGNRRLSCLRRPRPLTATALRCWCGLSTVCRWMRPPTAPTSPLIPRVWAGRKAAAHSPRLMRLRPRGAPSVRPLQRGRGRQKRRRRGGRVQKPQRNGKSRSLRDPAHPHTTRRMAASAARASLRTPPLKHAGGHGRRAFFCAGARGRATREPPNTPRRWARICCGCGRRLVS